MLRVLLFLLIPVVIILLILFCLPRCFGYSIYLISQEGIFNYEKDTVLYIKKKNKKVKKNDLILIKGNITRVLATDETNAVIRNTDTSDIIILKMADGIETVKFSIPKVGIILSKINTIKKKVIKK